MALVDLLAFMRSQGESQADWEGLLGDLYRRGLEGRQLGLIVTDGCPGLAAAIPTVYPRVRHQRCWVHKMRNILEHVRKRDYDEVKKDPRRFISRKAAPSRNKPFAASGRTGSGSTGPWCGDCNGICRNCCRASLFLGICGGSCALPT